MIKLTKHIEEWMKDKSYEDLVNELVDLKVHGENTQENKFWIQKIQQKIKLYLTEPLPFVTHGQKLINHEITLE